mgnify:CR=1 FL=1
MSTRIALAAALCLLACDHADPPRRPTSSGTTSTNGAAPHERRLSQPKRAPGEPVRVRDSGVSPDGGGARDAGIALTLDTEESEGEVFWITREQLLEAGVS